MSSIVIVSRDPEQALRWRRELAAASHDVVAITNAARSARTLLLQHRPRVVVCELRLHDGTATAMIQWLAGEPDAQRPRIVAVARDPADPLLREAMRSGADTYHLHGAGDDDVDLCASVRQALHGEAALDPALARALLDHFDRLAPLSHDRHAVEQSPLQLEADERELLLRVASGTTLADLAEQRTIHPHRLGQAARTVWRKLQWDRRAGSLQLQLA